MKRNHKHTKLFYKFLVENSLLFPFLEILGNTKYKTIREHCAVNNPSKFIASAIAFGVPYGVPYYKITTLPETALSHRLRRVEWEVINKLWGIHLQKSKYNCLGIK